MNRVTFAECQQRHKKLLLPCSGNEQDPPGVQCGDTMASLRCSPGLCHVFHFRSSPLLMSPYFLVRAASVALKLLMLNTRAENCMLLKRFFSSCVFSEHSLCPSFCLFVCVYICIPIPTFSSAPDLAIDKLIFDSRLQADPRLCLIL